MTLRPCNGKVYLGILLYFRLIFNEKSHCQSFFADLFSSWYFCTRSSSISSTEASYWSWT